jgi:hypothetical protein
MNAQAAVVATPITIEQSGASDEEAESEEGTATNRRHLAVQFLSWALSSALHLMDSYLGPAPPELSLPEARHHLLACLLACLLA